MVREDGGLRFSGRVFCGNISRGRLRRGFENNIRKDLKEIVWEGWINLAGDRDR
jgi:hypothetical protein